MRENLVSLDVQLDANFTEKVGPPIAAFTDAGDSNPDASN